jgi:hypothetical protein
MLWHQILGHIGEKGQRALENKYLLDRLNHCALEFDCVSIAHMKNRIVFNSIAALLNL